MKVKWKEGISASYEMMLMDSYPKDFKSSDFDKNYEGEVIGSNRSFWGDTYLTVTCDDGKIRDVEKGIVTTIKEK